MGDSKGHGGGVLRGIIPEKQDAQKAHTLQGCQPESRLPQGPWTWKWEVWAACGRESAEQTWALSGGDLGLESHLCYVL